MASHTNTKSPTTTKAAGGMQAEKHRSALSGRERETTLLDHTWFCSPVKEKAVQKQQGFFGDLERAFSACPPDSTEKATGDSAQCEDVAVRAPAPATPRAQHEPIVNIVARAKLQTLKPCRGLRKKALQLLVFFPGPGGS